MTDEASSRRTAATRPILEALTRGSRRVRPDPFVLCPHDRTDTDRPSRARHRPAPNRPLARGRRRLGVEPRSGVGVHARRVREGLLRRPHGGLARLVV